MRDEDWKVEAKKSVSPKLALSSHYHRQPLFVSLRKKVSIMSAPREGPNPLRPYYIPPSVGPSHRSTPTVSANVITRNTSAPAAAKASFGSSARDILSDLDYGDYLSDDTPSAAGILKRLLDQVAWKYTTVLLAQPFEVAKTVLQVQYAGNGQHMSPHGALNEDMRRRPGRHREEQYGVTMRKGTDFIIIH